MNSVAVHVGERSRVGSGRVIGRGDGGGRGRVVELTIEWSSGHRGSCR